VTGALSSCSRKWIGPRLVVKVTLMVIEKILGVENGLR
jgi:hypothetical protein